MLKMACFLMALLLASRLVMEARKTLLQVSPECVCLDQNTVDIVVVGQ